MNPKQCCSKVFASLLFLIVAAASPLMAQDVATIDTVTASGNTVDVPVYIRDLAGTPLGLDQAAGSKIQAYTFKVNYAPAAAVQSVTFTRAGITAGLTPAFEVTPSTTGSISLLDSFSESTNLIPFTINAPSPGDLVAHLTFTLAPSAVPGSSISLVLDVSQTELTNQGGSLIESAGNGNLTLVNGAINIPQLSLALVPNSLTIDVGESTSFLVQASGNVSANTTVTLGLSNPAIATMPSSVLIASGTRSANFTVIGAAVGNGIITAALPSAAGGATATAALTVKEPAVQCTTPAVPQINGPATADAGKPYSISWAAVSGATDYVIDEATDANFLSLTSTNVTATSASFTHATANRYYYRVRARNQSTGCNTSSFYSNVVSVLVSVLPVAQTRYLPVVGSVPGSLGSYFKTSVQLYNAKSSPVSGKIVFHTQAVSGSSSDPSIAYSIPSGQTLSYADLLPAMGIASGLGSADLVADAGSSFPIALARVFNDAGAAGTTGLAFEPMPASDALQNGETGVLIAPADTRFRLNIGVRTLEQQAGFNVTVRSKDGSVVKSTSASFSPTFFRQFQSSDILGGYVLAGGETITIQMTSGSAFIYGSTTDNATQDPSVQFAKKVE
jgi:hypothetical protein